MKEQIAAVRARLDAIAATYDLSGILDEEVTAEARALAGVLAGAEPGDRQAAVGSYVLGWLHWYRSVASSGDLSARESDAAAINFLPLFADPLRSPPQLPELLLPQLIQRTIRIATAADMPIGARIVLWRRVLDATSEQHPEYPGRLAYLSMLLQQRSASSAGMAALADLEEAIQVARTAIARTPQGDPQRPMYRSSLVSMLASLSDLTGRPEPLDEAVQAGRLASAEVRDDDPVRGAIWPYTGRRCSSRLHLPGRSPPSANWSRLAGRRCARLGGSAARTGRCSAPRCRAGSSAPVLWQTWMRRPALTARPWPVLRREILAALRRSRISACAYG